MAHLFGCHAPDAGGIPMAARRAANAGARSLQIFTAVPKYYNEKVGVRPERVERFRDALAATRIAPEHVVSHAAYVLNVATPEPEKWERASLGLAKELERSNTLGLGMVCFHPGAATDGDRPTALARVTAAMVRAREGSNGPARLLVENTAGAGNTVAKTPEEIAGILGGLPPSLRGRAGYGLDTCHLFASGFDIAASRESLGAVLDAFESAVGEPPAFFHFNDSEGALGSNKDRHALIGEGQIGESPFAWLLADRRSRGVPLVLETPQAAEPAEDDDSADEYDARMIRLLERLAEP